MKVIYSDLKNKRVFISGGGSGIGATIVEYFCEQKSEVYFIDIDLKSSKKLIKNIKKKGLRVPKFIECNILDVKKAIEKLKSSLIKKGEASELFGNEKDDSFKGILGSISQTVFGELAYPTIEEQSAQILYSIIKGHAFSDGNKRIGSFIFVWFLEQNNFHLKSNG